MKTNDSKKTSATRPSKEVLDRICSRVHYLTTQMIYMANDRSDVEKGDPKIGGHPAACASSLHITGALHLLVKTGFDYIANKPHAAPVDHAYNYVLDLLLKEDHSKLSDADRDLVMQNLRKFPQGDEPVFQSYHSTYDPDHHGFLPSGTVGIPPVNVGYLAHAYTFCKEHGYNVPENAHFWAILGDSEFREGSVFEATPEFAERQIGNLTWILDYNRQSLDGHRITNKDVMNGNDALRVERTMAANGWEVIQVRHGHARKKLFAKPDGALFQKLLEEELTDYELQAILLVQDMAGVRKGLLKQFAKLKKFLDSVSDSELYAGLRDFGGHDIFALADAMEQSKLSKNKPTIIIAHTLKGWGLRNAAAPGNHSALPSEDEMNELRAKQKLPDGKLFARFEAKTDEGKFLLERGSSLYKDMMAEAKLRDENHALFQKRFSEFGEIPTTFGINLKMASYPHTQWMLGQCTAKLTRIANSPVGGDKDHKALLDDEKAWKSPSELLISMAPDVGTSTNLNPAMDGKIFGVAVVPDYENEMGVKDRKTPDLVPGEDKSDRFLRFEIAECNVMSCLGSYGRIRDMLGIPMMPLMTVYDFFIKRAHDQFFYNLYWKSSFILVGTPSGVTLSPEGAQHGWKSDLQIPNQMTWEPFFCVELEWIMADAVRRHMLGTNEGRTGVVIRGVTRGIDQRLLTTALKRQTRFKTGLSENQLLHPKAYPQGSAVDESTLESIDENSMMAQLQEDVLAGAYYLVDYRGYAGYEPGDNVVTIFAMGSLGTEALKASEQLLERGIYANVVMVTSPDLLVGNHAHANNYEVLRQRLGLSGALILQPSDATPDAAGLVTLSGRRMPVVSVHDGEPGLLDNIGSIIGVRHESLAVRKHSRSGRPADIYAYHHIDAHAVVEAVGQVLSETALETVRVSPQALQAAGTAQHAEKQNWRDLWPATAAGTSGHVRDDH